jgi:DNA-binding HxlR family transcriptional regulator
VRSVACEGGELDATLKELNAEGWNIRQVYHEPPTHYRVFAQREIPVAA